MFSTRHEWFQHEFQAHRRVWQCAHGCPGSFGTQNQFEAHARVQHPDFTSPEILVALSNLSIVPFNGETPAECCFCHQQGLTLSKLERHLGRHQESLALFALTRIGQEDDGTDVDEENYPQPGKCSSEEELSSQGNTYTVSEDEEIQESNAQMLSDVANLRQPETSGLVATASVLRQFQLTIQALNVLNKKASTLPQHIKYGHYLEGLRQILQDEDSRYRSACVQVLSLIDITSEERTHMLNNTSLYVWEDKRLEEKLNKSLHTWYGRYTKVVGKMLEAFSRVDKLLTLGSGRKTSHHVRINGRKLYSLKYGADAVQIQTNDEVNIVEGSRRLKLNPRNKGVNEAIAHIIQTNRRLETLLREVDLAESFDDVEFSSALEISNK